MRLAAISLIIPEYDQAIAFFCKGLGFELCEDIDQGPKRWVSVAPPGGGSRLILARASDDRQTAAIGDQGAGRVWLFLHTDDFDRDHARLTRAGAVFEEEPRLEPYGKVAVWCDPFGNRWDLIEPI